MVRTMVSIAVVLLGCSVSSHGAPSVDAAVDAGPDPMESDISVCLDNVDCIVVPYSHCCGSTKRAIHARFLEAYNAHPEWQVFNDPGICAVIGACRSDSEVTEARCDNGFCALVYP